MDPNSNMLPINPAEQPLPGAPAPMPQPAQMSEQPAPIQPVYPEQAMPASPSMPVPAPMDMSAQPQPAMAPAPQPLFSPMTPPMPGQPVPGSMQPAFMPMAASQMPSGKSKKKLFIIGGVVLVLVAVGVGAFIFASKAALIGSLSSDSYQGINYKRPASWVKDTSVTNSLAYHPKTSLGKASDGKPTYALFMNIQASNSVFGSAPNDLNATDKATLQGIIDKDITGGSSDLLPTKYDVGCSTDPAFKEKPAKIDIKDSFLAVKYSFTCKSASDSASTFYFSVVDVVPNNKDTEYLVDMRAASESIYKTNSNKIDEILGTLSF